MKKHRGVVIIITAALLLESVAVVQYIYTHHLLESELDKRAESNLTMKAIIIRGMLDVMETTLKEHHWDVERNITHADSMFEATKQIIKVNPTVKGAFLTFIPDYYPEKGRLFEPYAYKDEDGIHLKDLASEEGHDYTGHPAFTKMMELNEPFWTDPYYYEEGGVAKSLTTFLYPLHNDQGSIVAISGIDISLDWLGDTLNANTIYPSSFILLLTESGELITSPQTGNVTQQDVEKVVSIINDSTMKRSKSQSGLSKIIHFHDSDNNGASVFYANMKGRPHWQIAVVCYDAEVYKELHWMGINALVLMLIVFSILGFIIRNFILSERKLSLAKTEKERIDNELGIAKSIQHAMLAHGEAMAGRSDIIVAASLKPAREVGGDLYDYFIRDEKMFFCIGDVSGKGIPSALVMAMTQTLFRAVSSHESNPAHIVETINETACSNNKTNMFATLFIGVLDLPTGRLRYCNAGHDIPVVMGASSVSTLPVEANLPVGLFDDFKYQLQETTLTKGTTLFLYTDGLTEARNVSHKLFGTKRLMNILKKHQEDPPEKIIQVMTNCVLLFAGDEEQSDDLTMLVINYSPQTDDYTQHGEVTLKNNFSELQQLHAFLKSVAEKLDLDASLTRNIRLAVEEAVVNVMDYAYPTGTEGSINVKAMSNSICLKLVISDAGMPFNPTEVAKADTTLSVEDRPVGGLGLLLVRELMDSINYERIEGKNILTLKKNCIKQ